MARKDESRFFYGWIIVGVVSISMMLAYAMRSSFTVFYVAILDEFGWTRANTAGIFSLSLIVYGISGIVAGILLDKVGPRNLFPAAATLIALGALWCSQASEIWEFYLAFGLIVAFGQCALGYVPSMALINYWFVKRRGFVLGIPMFGVSLSFLLTPLTQHLRETVGWRVAFMIFAGGLFAIAVPLNIAFIRHRPQDMGLLPDGVKRPMGSELERRERSDTAIIDQEWTLPRALRSYRLWLLLVIVSTIGLVENFPKVHQVAFITEVGYSPMFAAVVFSIFGLLLAVGPLAGLLSDRIGREMCFTGGAICIAFGSAVALVIKGPGLEWAWYLSSVSYGLGLGLVTPTLPATFGDLFLGRSLGSIVGFINIGYGAGGAVGPLLAAYLYDVTGEYTIGFVMVIVAILLGAILMWLVAPRKVRMVIRENS